MRAQKKSIRLLEVLVAIIAMMMFSPSHSKAVTAGEYGPRLLIAAGGSHSLAVKSDGTLYAWGYNYYGQLGDGSTINKDEAVQVGSDDDWVFVAAGNMHSVALKADGTLWAWGYNYYGQLGSGTTTNESEPVQVGSDDDWVFVAAGAYHTVAVKSDHTLWAWGDNSACQLGLGGCSGSENLPQQVIGTDWAYVAAGDWHTVALKLDGTLWHWGTYTLTYWSPGSSPTKIGNDNDWSFIWTTGSDHNIATKQDGTLWAWGGNYNGQLGHEYEYEPPSYCPMFQDDELLGFPVEVEVIDPDTEMPYMNWDSVSGGGAFTIGVVDGKLFAWGCNEFGSLGNGTTDPDCTAPVQVEIDDNWVYVSAGLTHSLAMKSDGTLWAWGDNGSGQLGGDMVSNDCYDPELPSSPICCATPIYVKGTGDPYSTAAEIVAIDGGTVVNEAGTAEVYIPPEALSADTTITIDVFPKYEIQGVSGEVISLGYDFGPTGTTFNSDATIKLYYPDGVDPELLDIYYFDEVAGEWVPQGATLDETNNCLTLEVDHFTSYCIVQEQVIEAGVDITPDTLNLKSKGNWITCYIELPEGYEVSGIDINTVELGENTISAEASPTEVGDYDNDGIPDLMVKFDREAVQHEITVGSVSMTVSGSLIDDSEFQGADTVLVIDKGKEHTDETDPSSVVY